MKVILLQDVKALGKKGDLVEVSDGYARNFILPKKVGIEANGSNMNDLKLQKANEEKVAKEQNWTLPECKIMSYVISATKYPYTDEEGWAFRGKICVSSYGEGQAASLKVKDVCNRLLHSYVWGVAGYADQKGFAGFLVASDFDKEKFVHFVSFDEWQKVIDAAIKNGAF